ncbi:MAG: replicative DNA helicase [Gammaproteobacteria bacterium]|nr:replicative DNA helicase [Gammaproteobacteria bacterium]|tara:strand:- start:1802 stop:3187 length:1386 start_codon:yes stop_codon:yes gene_type:complete
MATTAQSQSKIESLGHLTLPPHSTDAEAALLGALMLDPEGQAYDKIASIVTERDFYHPENKSVFVAIQKLSEDQKLTDLLTVSDWLDSSGKFSVVPAIEYISELVDNTAGTANTVEYAKIVREKALLRELITISNQIAQSAYKPENKSPSELVDEAEQRIFEIAERGTRKSSYLELNQTVNYLMDELDKRAQKGGGLTGISSGFKKLDELTTGFQKGELIIIAGRPSMGKTALALNIAEHTALADNNAVAVFSLEMSAEQLAFRLISSLGRVNQTALKTGKLRDQDWDRIDGAILQMKDMPIYIDDTPSLTPVELRARARRIQREKGLSLIVIDYLQLMQVPGSKENRATEISEISRNLKALARELKIPIIALSQLNRGVEQRVDKKPLISDLRESGAIEQDADVIAFIYREEVYNEETDQKGRALINVAKQRNGPTGSFNLTFLGQYTKFENYIQGYKEY